MRALAALSALAVAFAGCLAPTEEVTPGAGQGLPASAMEATGIDTEEFEGVLSESVGTPVRTVSSGEAPTFEIGDNVTGYVIEVEWTASRPTNEKLSVWVRPAGVGAPTPENAPNLLMAKEPTAKAEGASPLRIALPVDKLDPDTEYEVLVRASSPGVAVQQEFTILLTTFTGVAFDEAYSALGDHEHLDRSQ